MATTRQATLPAKLVIAHTLDLTPLPLHPSTDHGRNGAMVNIVVDALTPIDVIALRRHVHRPVALVAVAGATAARTLAATVVVGNDVVDTICGVPTGANPGHHR